MIRFLYFLLWYILMAIFIFPMGWYIFNYTNLEKDWSELLMLFIPCLVLLLFIINEYVRDGIIFILKFPFRILDELTIYFSNRKLKKYGKRDYIKIKN